MSGYTRGRRAPGSGIVVQRFFVLSLRLFSPKIVVGVGERAYRALLDAYGVAAGSFHEAVERQDSSVMRALKSMENRLRRKVV